MKHKIHIPLILVMLCIASVLYAQQDADAAGGDATGSGGSASFSVGQVVYTYISGSNGSSNQGVQQPYEIFTTGIDDNENISLSMTVFPNPTQSIINLKIESTDLEGFTFQLYDAAGRSITTQAVTDALTIVPMQSLASGSYLLEVSENGKPLKAFTIIKYN